MKCMKCGYENPTTAEYCHMCGTAFTEQQRQEAYDRTIYGKLDRLENLKGWADLSNITGNIFFRLAVIACLGVMALCNVTRNGTHLSIAESSQYTLSRNGEEFYVTTYLDTISLITYLPKETETITVQQIENGLPKQEIVQSPSDPISVAKTDHGYYTIRADYTDEKWEELTVFVCTGDDHV